MVLWHLTDSALPTGGFAHSAGLETYVSRDEVFDPDSFRNWLWGYLNQASFNEALTVKLAHDIYTGTGAQQAKIAELDAFVHACQTPRQVRQSMNSMGKRWAKVAAIVAPSDTLVVDYHQDVAARRLKGNPAIAAGLVFAAVGAPLWDSVAAYLTQMANSMTQNAIRAIPLGQDAGQKILVASYPKIEQATDMTLLHHFEDLGVVAPRLEIAQMAHETLGSRMFMS